MAGWLHDRLHCYNCYLKQCGVQVHEEKHELEITFPAQEALPQAHITRVPSAAAMQAAAAAERPNQSAKSGKARLRELIEKDDCEGVDGLSSCA